MPHVLVVGVYNLLQLVGCRAWKKWQRTVANEDYVVKFFRMELTEKVSLYSYICNPFGCYRVSILPCFEGPVPIHFANLFFR